MARRKKRTRRRRRKAVHGLGAALLRHSANAGVAVLTALLVLAGAAAIAARDLPDTDNLWASDGERPPRITLLDIDGAPIPVHGESHGAPVRLADLPAHVPLAVLAVEDRNFRHHIGFNPVSVARALMANAEAGEIVQGGSTVTQQLAKNLFLSPDRTMKRKIEELMLALWLELQFTKDEILTLYLNRVYFGAGAYGIDAASHRYFAKPARSLSVAEAAVLAGLLKAPSRYAPSRNPEDAGARARIAIDSMEKAKFITSFAAARARRETVVLATPKFAAAPYFVDHILGEARARAGRVDADLIVQTTFDPRLQAALERGAAAGFSLAPLPEGVQVAAVVLDAEGAVRAMIGGRDYRKSQYNRATQALRQPGSAFKPFVYLAALEAGLEPGDGVLDAPLVIDKWRPDNYGGRFYGEVSLTQALALSLNTATVRLQERVGRGAVRVAARRMGLARTSGYGASLALGVDAVSPLELAGAYVPLVNGGFRIEPHAIDSIRTTDGAVVYRRDAAMRDTAASFHSIAALNGMLQAVVSAGTGRAAAIGGVVVAGKTGTTQDSRDAWFAGHAGGLVAVVWLGRDDNRPMEDVTGGGAPAVIWRETMRRALEDRGPPASADRADPLAALLDG
jgi:penicillin-binding protein 1A